MLNNKGGERVVAHKDALLCGTGNTNGMGDETGLYASTSVQSYATMNRWQMHLHIPYLSEDEEKEMMTLKYHKAGAGMPIAEITKMVHCAKLIRDSYIGNTISCPISTRQVIAGGKWLSMCAVQKRSFQLAFGNSLNKVDGAVVNGIFQRIFGE